MRALTLTIIATLAAVPALARAQEGRVEEAKTYFEAGRRAYKAGQYAVAITAFEEAYRREPRPTVTYALAQAHRRHYYAGRDPLNLKRAVVLYREVVEKVDRGQLRDESTQYLAELEPLLERAEQKGPIGRTPEAPAKTQLMISSLTEGAYGAVGDGELAELPTVVDVKPGDHRVRVEAPGWHSAERQAIAVEGRLVVIEVNLKEKPARLAVRGPSGADVSIDGQPAGELPRARPFEIPAGRHFVAVTRRGHHAWSREVTVDRDEELALSAELHRTDQRTLSYWFFGGAGALAAGAGVAALLAYGAQSDAQDIEARVAAGMGITPADLDAHNEAVDDRDRAMTATWILGGGAAAVAVTGLLLYLIDHPRIEAPRQEITPAIGADGAGVSYTRRF